MHEEEKKLKTNRGGKVKGGREEREEGEEEKKTVPLQNGSLVLIEDGAENDKHFRRDLIFPLLSSSFSSSFSSFPFKIVEHKPKRSLI